MKCIEIIQQKETARPYFILVLSERLIEGYLASQIPLQQKRFMKSNECHLGSNPSFDKIPYKIKYQF
jgi:hypothetical protein